MHRSPANPRFPQPAVWYLSELEVNAAGALKVADTRPVADTAVGGLWHTRSGSVTPWGTHLGEWGAADSAAQRLGDCGHTVTAATWKARTLKV